MIAGNRVVFVDGVRTPFGRAGEKGMYWNTRADDLIVKAMMGLLERNPAVPVEEIDDVAIAATTQQGDQGLTLGRTAGILAGLPRHVPGFAIDRMCAGAMTAVTTTAGGIAMGATAERLHDRFPHLTKERADAYALRSQQKVAAAYAAGHIQSDLIPVSAKTTEGWTLATTDEAPRPETTLEGLAALKTPFRPHGRVTAGNASGLNDGATICMLASEQAAEEFGLGVKMRMVSFAFAGVEPEVMGIGPVPATEKALRKAGLSISDIGLFEVNEAFAVQVLAFLDYFGIADDDPRVNEYGGAIALGHPLASSGVRLMIQLAHQFERHPEVRYGMTTMCIGLGQGGTVIWENPHYKGAK